ncbi:MAG: hypothetical protein WC570_03205 [Patescibacteria group bacterium]
MFRKLGYIESVESDHYLEIPGGDNGLMDITEGENGNYTFSKKDDQREEVENLDSERPKREVFGIIKVKGEDKDLMENLNIMTPMEMKVGEEYEIFADDLAKTAIMNW